jgi:hypothetical protein
MILGANTGKMNVKLEEMQSMRMFVMVTVRGWNCGFWRLGRKISFVVTEMTDKSQQTKHHSDLLCYGHVR